MATGINLAGRIPAIVRPISGKVFIVGIVLALFLIGAVVFGFCYRIKRQERMKEAQQTQTVASDAATSNREQIEGGQPAPPSTLSGLPIGTSQTASGQTASPSPAYAGNAANQNIIPAYQPSYYPTSPVASMNGPKQLRTQALSRQMEREQQAREAPTGVQEQRTTAAQANPSSALDAAQNDIARINSMPPTSTPALYPASVPPVGVSGLAENEGAQGFRSQNDQTGKRQFDGGGEGAGDDYLKTTRTPPLSPWVVQRGTVIPAALPNKVVSDLPGDLIAEVVRDVYDSPSQKYVEIPAGSRLVGEYNSSVSYGQKRGPDRMDRRLLSRWQFHRPGPYAFACFRRLGRPPRSDRQSLEKSHRRSCSQLHPFCRAPAFSKPDERERLKLSVHRPSDRFRRRHPSFAIGRAAYQPKPEYPADVEDPAR